MWTTQHLLKNRTQVHKNYFSNKVKTSLNLFRSSCVHYLHSKRYNQVFTGEANGASVSRYASQIVGQHGETTCICLILH